MGTGAKIGSFAAIVDADEANHVFGFRPASTGPAPPLKLAA